MVEHERLRRLAATLIMELHEAGWPVEADNVLDALSWICPDDPANVERLTIAETQWQDAPDGDGLHWVHCCDRPTPIVVRGDEASPLGGSIAYAAIRQWTPITDLQREAKRRGKPLLWSRLPDPPPVPADDASATPSHSPDACNLPLRAPFIGPEETCEQCGQQARVHRHWSGEEVRRG